VPFYFPRGALPLKKNIFVWKFIGHLWYQLMGKHFIDPKSSEILSIFQVFLCTMQIALFWPKLLPALFLLRSLDIPALLNSWQKHYMITNSKYFLPKFYSLLFHGELLTCIQHV
jgi:hypothetical protein